jgi:hypothetical protein
VLNRAGGPQVENRSHGIGQYRGWSRDDRSACNQRRADYSASLEDGFALLPERGRGFSEVLGVH